MTDERLRALERRWLETASIEDEKAYLLGRMRAGYLERSTLQLAAYCGHQAAIEVLGKDALPSSHLLKDWAAGMLQWGNEVCIRAAIIAAHAIINNRSSPRLQEAFDASLTWIRDPDKRHDNDAGHRAAEAGYSALLVAREWLCDLENHTQANIAYSVGYAARACGGAPIVLAISAVTSAGSVAEASVPVIGIRQAISNALIPWALGYGDQLDDIVLNEDEET